ncbi:hypothetical protein KR084_012624, partial [Drosophila pseudotakahashii]
EEDNSRGAGGDQGGGNRRGGDRDRNGDGGGFRGGRREGGDGGGYRGRRDNNEDAVILPPIPTSLDEEVVGEFIASLDVNAYATNLARIRKLRDYLFKAFRALVEKERISLERLDQEKRGKKGNEIHKTLATMETFIEDIDRLLVVTERGKRQIQNLGVDWRANLGRLERNAPPFVVPPRSTIRGRKKRSPEVDVLSKEYLRQLEDLFRQGGGQPDLNASGDEEQLYVNPRPTYGSIRYHQVLSEEFVADGEMRPVRSFSPRELLHNLSWPNETNSNWLEVPEPKKPIRAVFRISTTAGAVMTEPPTTPIGSDYNSMGVLQASSSVNLARHLLSQDRNTPAGSNVNISPAAVSDRGTAMGISTPNEPISDPGLSFIPHLMYDEMATPLSVPEGAASTPIGPSLPGEHSMKSDMGNELAETAIVGQTGLSIVRSRLGGTPSSTPFLSFQPRLPVIDEEHHRPSTLQMSLPPPQEEAAVAVIMEESTTTLQVAMQVAEPMTPPSSPPRDWRFIFRTRDELVNYVEGPAPRPAPRVRRPRRNPARNPRTAAIPTPPTTPGRQPIQSEEEMLNSRHIATNFVSSFMRRQMDVAIAQQVQHTNRDILPPNGEIVPEAVLPPNGEIIPEVVLLPIEEIMPEVVFPPNEEIIPEVVLPIIPQVVVSMAVDEDPPEVSNALANVSYNAHVTDVQLLPKVDIHSLNIASMDRDRMLDLGVNIGGSGSTVMPISRSEAKQKALRRVHVEDLAYISRHANMLRLMVDHNIDLTKQGKATVLRREGSKTYYAMPAVNCYDPKIILDMDMEKIRVVHGLLLAIVRQVRVDIQKESFIKNSRDRAIVFRILLELKAANIIYLSSDGRFFSLR